MNWEIPDVKTGFWRDRGTRVQIANICWIMEKARRFQKKNKTKQNICFCFIDHEKAFDCINHKNCGKILKRCEYQTTLPASWSGNLYADQEAIVRSRPGTTDWFKIGKEEHQGCMLSPYLFNFYAEYIMRNARLDESQLESILPGEISSASDMQMAPP